MEPAQEGTDSMFRVGKSVIRLPGTGVLTCAPGGRHGTGSVDGIAFDYDFVVEMIALQNLQGT